MQSHTCFYYEDKWQHLNNAPLPANSYQLVLVFADRFLLEDSGLISTLKQSFTAATIVSCSTSGEIYYRHVYDKSLVATAVHFEKTELVFAQAIIAGFADTHALGQNIAAQLPAAGLKYALVISNGGKINGSELV